MSKFEFNEETKKKLLGILPFSQAARYRFTPEIYESIDEKLRPVFCIRPFTVGEKEKVSQFYRMDEGPERSKLLDNLCRSVLVSIENNIDLGTGELIADRLEADEAYSADIYGMVPIPVQAKIFTTALEISGLTSLEKFSLKSLPPSTPGQ